MRLMNKKITVRSVEFDGKDFNPTEVTISLEEAILNPNGLNLEDLGLALLNIEREKRGLNLYKLNKETGTFDEILDHPNYGVD